MYWNIFCYCVLSCLILPNSGIARIALCFWIDTEKNNLRIYSYLTVCLHSCMYLCLWRLVDAFLGSHSLWHLSVSLISDRLDWLVIKSWECVCPRLLSVHRHTSSVKGQTCPYSCVTNALPTEPSLQNFIYLFKRVVWVLVVDVCPHVCSFRGWRRISSILL